jgi:hypothetical protein
MNEWHKALYVAQCDSCSKQRIIFMCTMGWAQTCQELLSELHGNLVQHIITSTLSKMFPVLRSTIRNKAGGHGRHVTKRVKFPDLHCGNMKVLLFKCQITRTIWTRPCKAQGRSWPHWRSMFTYLYQRFNYQILFAATHWGMQQVQLRSTHDLGF